MLLFKKPFHAGLVAGVIRVTFRAWDKPHVRAGGRYRCHPIGVLEVDSVVKVRIADITAADATLAGFATLAELHAFLRSGPRGDVLNDDSELFRVELHHGGDGDRVEVALDDQLSAADIEMLAKRLARLDGKKPWTAKTMQIIAKHPRVAASKLAAKLGRETQPFKIDVRKLKKLGLTQSFEVGYEISPRGRAYLNAQATRTGRLPRSRARSASVATRGRASSRT
jgi:hypothetical protein